MTASLRRRWFALAVFTAAAALAATSVVVVRRENATKKLMRSAAASPWRPIEGRLTGFSYAPRRTCCDDEASSQLRAVAAGVLAGRDREPRTSAVALLLYGKSADAAAALESLAARDGDADLWSDLAAARLQDGVASDDARTIARALVAADHALALEPAHEAATFNRAMTLDALGLRFAAAPEWRRYLLMDPASPWADEARQRLRASERPTRDDLWKKEAVLLEQAMARDDVGEIERIVALFPRQTRGSAEATYLWQWGNAFLAGDSRRAQERLTDVRSIAAALKTFNGDSLLAATVAALDTADDASLREAARGFQAYGQARDDNLARKVAESLRGFAEAERAFAAARVPMELAAAYYRANALVDLGDAAQAQVIESNLDSRIDPSYRSLRAHFFWLRLRLTNNAGRHYESLLATRAAREIFEQLGEVDYADRLRTGEAAMLARLGRDRESWQGRRLALAGASASGKWNLVETAIEAIAREEIDGPDRDIARSLFKVQVRAPSALPLMRFNGLLWRAYLDARTNGGSPDLTAARNAAARVPDAKQRTDCLDELRLAEALAERDRDPAEAERKFSEVIDYRTRAGLWTYIPAIHVQRARSRRASGRLREAEEDLRSAIALIESRRVHVHNDSLRDAFLGHSDDAYDELGDLLLDRGDWKSAFEISERARARVLLDKAGRDPMSLDEIAAATREDVVGVHYSSFASRTLIVTIESGRATHTVVNVSRTELAALRDAFMSDPASTLVSRRLYDLLIASVRDRLGPDRMLVIVPDETTYGIPFAALREPGGRFLIEEAMIALAPAGAAIAAPSPTLSTRKAHVTIVADPAFSTAMFPRLERLPAARDDAVAVKAVFAQATTFVGGEATRSALESAARGSDAVHIAAHAFSSSRDASLSLFALAPETGNEGALYLEDIERLDLGRRPLVVLAGCETGSFGAGKGSIRSLAHAFLAAGSRAVLAALWSVEDQRTSVLTDAFYRNLAEGSAIPAALRDAQLEILRKHPPQDWSPFQIHLGVPGKTEPRAPLTQ